jgi:hypothetical protein
MKKLSKLNFLERGSENNLSITLIPKYFLNQKELTKIRGGYNHADGSPCDYHACYDNTANCEPNYGDCHHNEGGSCGTNQSNCDSMNTGDCATNWIQCDLHGGDCNSNSYNCSITYVGECGTTNSTHPCWTNY